MAGLNEMRPIPGCEDFGCEYYLGASAFMGGIYQEPHHTTECQEAVRIADEAYRAAEEEEDSRNRVFELPAFPTTHDLKLHLASRRLARFWEEADMILGGKQ